VIAQVGSLAFQIDANQEEMKTMLDACLEKTEVYPGGMKSVAEQQEEAAVKPVSTEEAAWGPDSSRRVPPKAEERTQGNSGSWKKLAAARRGMTRLAGVAWRKGRGHTGRAVEQRRRKIRNRIMLQEEPKGRMLGKRRRVQLESVAGLRNQGLREQLRLRKERATGNDINGRRRRQELRLGSQKTFYATLGQTLEFGVVKRGVGTSIRLLKMGVGTPWRGRAPLKRKKSLLAALRYAHTAPRLASVYSLP
jgi:hypothetical protein